MGKNIVIAILSVAVAVLAILLITKNVQRDDNVIELSAGQMANVRIGDFTTVLFNDSDKVMLSVNNGTGLFFGSLVNRDSVRFFYHLNEGGQRMTRIDTTGDGLPDFEHHFGTDSAGSYNVRYELVECTAAPTPDESQAEDAPQAEPVAK